MPSERLPLYLFIGVGLLSAFYQIIGRDLLVQASWGKTIQPVSDFPYTCRRLSDPGLEACEDMWLSEGTRQLYLACSDSLARKEWLPNLQRLNASGRSQKDTLFVMDIDKPNGQSFSYRALSTPDYTGVNGDGKLYLVAVAGVEHADHIDLYLNNNRPSIDSTTGVPLDNTQTGANATIELFRITNPLEATSSAKHIKTFADPQIATPNRVAPLSSSREGGGFYFTNDHGASKVGLWNTLSPVVKTADVSFCSAQGVCKKVAGRYGMPNGLIFGRKDGRLYVPSTVTGRIIVYEPLADGNVKFRDEIRVGYPLDNMSEDDDGDFWVAGFPDMAAVMPMFDDPLGDTKAPSSVFRIRRRTEPGKTGYAIQKMLEDRDAEVLPVSTTVVHDVKTGRLFLSSVLSPFITVCDPSER